LPEPWSVVVCDDADELDAPAVADVVVFLLAWLATAPVVVAAVAGAE
jgi:hypothetical protein